MHCLVFLPFSPLISLSCSLPFVVEFATQLLPLTFEPHCLTSPAFTDFACKLRFMLSGGRATAEGLIPPFRVRFYVCYRIKGHVSRAFLYTAFYFMF